MARRPKSRGELKWFVEWSDSLRGWQVKRGGFCANWFKSKFLAEEERDRLNSLDT